VKAIAALSHMILPAAAPVAACLLLSVLCAAPSLALAPNGDQGWYWQMPTPSGVSAGNLLDVAFASDTDVWVVGGDGTVLHSAAAGTTWQPQESGTKATLVAVSFVDELHGWAVGYDSHNSANPGVLTYTSDGGTRWQALNLGDGSAKHTALLTSVSFVDRARGWIGTTTGRILRTSNGGATWTARALKGYSGYLLVDFVDARNGWAVGSRGHAWRTCNGGRSWQALRRGIGDDTFFMQVDFWDRRNGWALVTDDDTERFQVLSTSDGGVHWSPALSTARTWLTGLRMTGPTSGWVVGGDIQSLFGYYGAGLSGLSSAIIVRHTSNGGHNWTKSTFSTTCSPAWIAARGHTVCAVGSGIVTSTDGDVWTARSSGMQYSFAEGQALSADNVWALDSWGTLLHSTDGLRWQQQPGFPRWAASLTSLAFADAQHGWVVGAKDDDSIDQVGAVWSTVDGGGTWSEQEWPLAGSPVDVDCVDASMAWAVSSNTGWEYLKARTTLAHTDDGGANWYPQWVPQSAGLLCVDFVDSSTGWVAGAFEQQSADDKDEYEYVSGIARTTNGGRKWIRSILPTDAPYITDIQFVDALNGWAVGTDHDNEEGWLLRTSDGGVTWTRLPDVRAPLSAVHFLDDGRGWIGGDGVYATANGGATWTRVASGYGVADIIGLDADHLWALGDGFLLSTVNGSGDLCIPITMGSGDEEWHRGTVTVDLSASDPEGPVARTEYSLDKGATWQQGSSITFPAARDHSTDGEHEYLYRSVDAAGNVEPAAIACAYLDTVGPSCSVPRKAVVNSGMRGVLYFCANDATSGLQQVTITLRGRSDRSRQTIVLHAGNWGTDPAPSYYWKRFRCRLQPGRYRMEVRATDWAGNRQRNVGRGTLVVKASGAPEADTPWWPQGIPYDSQSPDVETSGRAPEAQGALQEEATLPHTALDLLAVRLGLPRGWVELD